MGWGWRRIAAVGVATLVLLGLAAAFAKSAGGEAALQDSGTGQAWGEGLPQPPEPPLPLIVNPNRAGKVGQAAQFFLQAGSAVLYANEARGGEGSGSAARAPVFGLLLHSSVTALSLSWVALAGVALLALASLRLHRRPVPSPIEEVSLLTWATARGPLFTQSVVYANLGPCDRFRGLRGLLEVSRSASSTGRSR